MVVAGILGTFPLLIVWLPGFFLFGQDLLTSGLVGRPNIIARAIALMFMLWAIQRGMFSAYKLLKQQLPISTAIKDACMLGITELVCFIMFCMKI